MMTRFAKNLPSIIDGAGKGVVLDTLMEDGPRHSINEGNYNIANLQAAGTNASRAIGNTIMSGASAAGAFIDGVLPGSPVGNLSKSLGLSSSPDLLKASSSYMSSAFTNVSDVGSNIATAATMSGTKNVAGFETRASVPSVGAGSFHNPVAPPPQHIQNAFSTPTGFNTSQAMSAGGSNYVDNAKFVSAAESSGENKNIRSSTRNSSK